MTPRYELRVDKTVLVADEYAGPNRQNVTRGIATIANPFLAEPVLQASRPLGFGALRAILDAFNRWVDETRERISNSSFYYFGRYARAPLPQRAGRPRPR